MEEITQEEFEAQIVKVDNIEYLHISGCNAAFKYSDCRRFIENRLKRKS
mgnify:CR=1 FL=1